MIVYIKKYQLDLNQLKFSLVIVSNTYHFYQIYLYDMLLLIFQVRFNQNLRYKKPQKTFFFEIHFHLNSIFSPEDSNYLIQ